MRVKDVMTPHVICIAAGPQSRAPDAAKPYQRTMSPLPLKAEVGPGNLSVHALSRRRFNPPRLASLFPPGAPNFPRHG
jgi:hypothetical protein